MNELHLFLSPHAAKHSSLGNPEYQTLHSPATIPVQVDTFYFFDASRSDGSLSSTVKAGKLLEYDATLEMCTLHEYQSNAINVRHYQPTWISPKGVI